MTLKMMNDILTLLALEVIADKRVLTDEVDTFVDTARHLQEIMNIDPVLSDETLFAWLESNYQNLQNIVSGSDFDRKLQDLFSRLEALPNKAAVLKGMARISIADGEVHVSEQALIILAARHWGINVPAFT